MGVKTTPRTQTHIQTFTPLVFQVVGVETYVVSSVCPSKFLEVDSVVVVVATADIPKKQDRSFKVLAPKCLGSQEWAN